MFFSGDYSTRKRVDLGGRSSKERDREKVLEQTRLERNRRLFQRRQNSAAIKIQKFFRGRRAAKVQHARVREEFFTTYGYKCQNVDRHCFGPSSKFLSQLLFFFNAKNSADIVALLETCRLIQRFVGRKEDAIILFAGVHQFPVDGIVEYRVKQLAYTCILAVHANRMLFKEQLFMKVKNSDAPATILLEAVKTIIDPELPWSCITVGYLIQRGTFSLLREIILSGMGDMKARVSAGGSSLEHALTLITCHIGEKTCTCPSIDPQRSFLSQILTIPFVWDIFPNLRGVFGSQGINHLCVRSNAIILPNDLSTEFPGHACLLGNILEATQASLSQSVISFDGAIDFVEVATYLFEVLPPLKSVSEHEEDVLMEDVLMEDEQMSAADVISKHTLDADLVKQISSTINPDFILKLTSVLFGGLSMGGMENHFDDDKAVAVGSACAFLHVAFNSLPIEHIMISLAYRTPLVLVLWNFIKYSYENQKWSILPERTAHHPDGAHGCLLVLAVFCPIYKHMLAIVDNEEFYEQEKPLSLEDIRSLIVILKQALWQLLWLNSQASSNPRNLAKSAVERETLGKILPDALQERVATVASELLMQLQDWNNRRQFAPASAFHADGVNDYFISQATQENSRAREILKLAPFLVPFTSRVKIFASQLAASRQLDGSHAIFSRNHLKIRRDHILEESFSHMSALSDEDLRGVIRITFVNEFGVEEAGIDGGGIFKDFMESITRAAFDIQYGLFKETSDHLLYPNPGSAFVHELHLQFFHFVGTLLAKAMFEGILVDIPFATFFLSKLKQKHNYLNDLPSLDPELYRHLIFLKHYQGDISELELYFVAVNNEYGEQVVEELQPGGKSIRVTNENVIRFIHLMANYRLNYQIRQQSLHFLRGFQRLIQKDWIDMFNEHELQLLISGSLDGLDVDDLRSNAQYTGGYHADHYVIELFWEVLKGLSHSNQMRFLKFVTGCSRGPLLGFKFLEPQFCIQRAAGSATEEALDRLPTSATCMNLLKLPPYRSKEQLEKKLLYAINAEAGFDLS